MNSKVFFRVCLILGFLQFASCGKFASRVSEEMPSDSATPLAPSVSSTSPMFFKFTSGRLNSTTTNTGVIQATVTSTNKKLQLGSDMSMTVTLTRNRLTPQ